MTDLSERLTNRVQISSDSLRSYVDAVEQAFGADVDYGQIVKFYDAEPIGPGRYGPPRESYRTSEFDDAYEHAPVYAPDQWFQQEAGKYAGGGSPAFLRITIWSGYTRPCALRQQWRLT